MCIVGEVTGLFEIGEAVLVVQQNVLVGQGTVAATCQTREELQDYFTVDHPLSASYQLCLQNKQVIYIIDFYQNMGQAGYLAHEVKKSRVHT